MKKLSEFIGKSRYHVSTQPVVELCCNDEAFNRWFNNKFLKWEHDPLTSEDVDLLLESISIFLKD